MSYIGQQLPADVFSGFTIDKFTGDGTANKALTLSEAPFNETAVLVTIDGVVQEPTDDFTVSGTTLTLVGTAANGSEINVTHLSGPVPVTQAASLDLNGASDKRILDADADTTISADTDDQIDFKAGGTDIMSLTATTVTINDGTTIITNDNSDTLTLQSADADASEGPVMVFDRASSSPADDDVIGAINFRGKDSGGNGVDYVKIRAEIMQESDGSEDGQLQFNLQKAGTSRNILTLDRVAAVINEDSQDIDFRVESDGVTHMLFVNGGGNTVGVGTTGDILGRLHVMNGDSGADADGAGDELVLEHDSHCGMTILSPNNLEGGIKFGDPQDNDAGRIQYDHANDAMFFMTSGSLHFNIASNGDLTATDTSIGSISDQRLKKDIVDFTYDINKFKQLKPRSFEWKNKSEHGDKTGLRGFIAQEVDSVDNHFVNSYSIKESYQPLDFALLDDSGTFTETKEYSISEELKNQIPDGKKVGDKYEVTSNKPRTTYDSKLGDKDAMYISIIQQLITRIEALEDA